jgi:hypothetical protein
MPARPKEKSALIPNVGDTSGVRDPVSLVVALGMVALSAGGIAAVFSAPLMALLGR